MVALSSFHGLNWKNRYATVLILKFKLTKTQQFKISTLHLLMMCIIIYLFFVSHINHSIFQIDVKPTDEFRPRGFKNGLFKKMKRNTKRPSCINIIMFFLGMLNFSLGQSVVVKVGCPYVHISISARHISGCSRSVHKSDASNTQLTIMYIELLCGYLLKYISIYQSKYFLENVPCSIF